MRRLQKTMRIRYAILMIILVVSLTALELSIDNYNYLHARKGHIQVTAKMEEKN